MSSMQFPPNPLGPGTFAVAEAGPAVHARWSVDQITASLLAGEWLVYPTAIGPASGTTVPVDGGLNYEAVIGAPPAGVFRLEHHSNNAGTGITAEVTSPLPNATPITFPADPLGPGTLDVLVRDSSGVPSSVLDSTAPFTVEARWSMGAETALLLGGAWEVAGFLESIGPGPEMSLGTTVVPSTGQATYTAQIDISPEALPGGGVLPSAVYRLVVVLSHQNFGAFSAIAAYADSGLLRIS